MCVASRSQPFDSSKAVLFLCKFRPSTNLFQFLVCWQAIVTRNTSPPKSAHYAHLPLSVCCCCCSDTVPIHRPLAIPHCPPPQRPVVTIRPTRTRRRFARRPAARPPIRTLTGRRPLRRATRRLRSATAAADPVDTRTIPSAPPRPVPARVATATAPPLPAGCRTEPPTDTTRTVSKRNTATTVN